MKYAITDLHLATHTTFLIMILLLTAEFELYENATDIWDCPGEDSEAALACPIMFRERAE
jgi:hypothetical protein